MTPDMLDPAPNMLGRRVRSSVVGGMVTARAAGDGGSPDLDVNSDVRGARAAYPGHGLLSWLLGRRGGASSFDGLRFPERQAPGAWYDPGGPGGAFGGGWADGVLTVRDRHIMTRFGTVRNPGTADSGPAGYPSPSAQAPPPPRYQMVNTTESWQVGSDHTASEDNTGEHNWVPVTGTAKRFPLGTQDGTQTLVMGPPLGSWRTYGVRGGAGMHGPAPDVWDPNFVTRTGAGGAGGRGRLVQQGAPGQQPADRRTIYGGVPHGLHSPTVPPLVVTGARQAAIPQMQPPRVDRPASSKIAGQSMSQTFPPEGSGGARPTPRNPNPGRTPGITSRFVSRT
jgi:hypothetical protein